MVRTQRSYSFEMVYWLYDFDHCSLGCM